MAISVTIPVDGHSIEGNKRSIRGTLSLDTSYPSGGYPITAHNFGLSVIESLYAVPRLGYLFEWDATNATLRVFRPNELSVTGGQAPGDVLQTDASDILGKTPAGNVSVRTTGPVEVKTGADLSAVTSVRWTAKGV